MNPHDLPGFLSVGPITHRTFDADGRLIIRPSGGVPVVMPGVSHKGEVPRELMDAASLALALDVLYKVPDLRVGREYTFQRESMADPQAKPGPLVYAYGTLVPIPLDWEWFAAHAVIAWGDDDVPREPAEAAWPTAVGPGLSWDRMGAITPSLFGRIRSTADIVDPKWAEAGFVAGQPWDGTMPELSRKERARFTGIFGFQREHAAWRRTHRGPEERVV